MRPCWLLCWMLLLATPANGQFLPPLDPQSRFGPPWVDPVWPGPIIPGPVVPGPILPAPVFPVPIFPGPIFPGPIFPGPPLDQSVLIDSRVIPAPPLPPVEVILHNGGPRELQVGVVDRLDPAGTRSWRIAPQANVAVTLQPDAGSQRLERYRVVTPFGQTYVKERTVPVPPVPRYEVVVHEWNIQSVAIDRTGKSPQVIEDINFQGRGLGRFELPPGAALQPGMIDVYRAARVQNNPGAVAPLVPAEPDPADAPSPLERAILDAQRDAANRLRQRTQP